MEDIDNIMTTFEAIVDFVSDLKASFVPKKDVKSPLALYFRLIKKTDMLDKNTVLNFVNPFKKFFDQTEKLLINDDVKAIEQMLYGTRIAYGSSERIYIDIHRFITSTDDDNKKMIRAHLINIYSLIKPSLEAQKALDDCDLKSQEQMTDMFKGIFEEINNSDIKDKLETDSPFEIAKTMMSNGALESIFKKFSGIMSPEGGGGINPDSMMKMMGSLMKGMPQQ